MQNLKDLAKSIKHAFKELEYLEVALTHKSYGNEYQPDLELQKRDNERLEFLGDAVLDLVISELLLEQYPSETEGDLSKMRASIVNEKSLAEIAQTYRLGTYIRLGKGEDQTGGREKDSILSSTLEAIIAAIYMDAGYEKTKAWVKKSFRDQIDAASDSDTFGDYKTRLQEIVQAKYKSAPKYEVLRTSGPDHAKTFEIQLMVNGQIISTANGKSKKEAEQRAAKVALDHFTQFGNFDQL